MLNRYFHLLAALLLMLVAANAQVNRPVIVNQFSYYMPFVASDPVFTTDGVSLEYNFMGYGGYIGQLTIKKHISQLGDTEIGFGIGLPYLLLRGKTVLGSYRDGMVMLAVDLGIVEGGRARGLVTTLGKVAFSYGGTLNRGVNRKFELGYSWYSGWMHDWITTFPRSRTIYGTITFEKLIFKKIILGIFGGPVLSILRYHPPQGGGYTISRWGNITYVDLVNESWQTEEIFRWSKQIGINAGMTVNYEF